MQFEYDYEAQMYWRRHKLSNGQYCMIGFEFDRSDIGDVEEYNVVFAVADKKKQLKGYFNASKENNITLKSTGRCGAEALYWARDMLLEFEQMKQQDSADYNITIRIKVAGENSRRFRLYEKVLSKYGYRKVPGQGNGDYPWYMQKTILDRGQIPHS